MFFKGIYDKTATYFSNLVNKIYSELSHLLVKMDTRIMKVQKNSKNKYKDNDSFKDVNNYKNNVKEKEMKWCNKWIKCKN